jgi:putative addiction module component (TIGR02574 family)
MTLAEILEEIPRLTADERRMVLDKLCEIDGEWIGGHDPFTDEQKLMIEARLEEHRRDPSSAIPWEEMRSRMEARFGRPIDRPPR